jgi:cell wall-associated NlpC family hydrolase
MTFSGITAIQAHIQAIEQQVSALGPPGMATTAGSGPATGADFASLLTDAMTTQSAVQGSSLGGTSGTTDPGAAAGSSSGELSSLLGQASALTGSDANGALGPTSANTSSLSSLASSLTGGAGSTTTSPDISSLLSSLTGSAGSTTSPDISSLLSSLTGSATTATSPSVTTQRFVDAALSQQGKPYVWGSSASASDPSPASFDCSELTKWAAARAGVTIPDGAAHQYVWLKEQGATMTVQQALQTPGALLFHFASEPQPGLGSEPPVAHVAISLGNGMTMEAKGHAYGVGIFPAGDRFNYAGMVPGMK